MSASPHATPGAGRTVSAAAPRRLHPRVAATLFGVALTVNVLVCVPFLFDPLDLLGAGQAAAAEGKAAEYVVLLSEASPDARHRFFAEHPTLRVVHEGSALGTLRVRAESPSDTALAELRAQPFALLVARGGGVFCQ